MTTDGQPAPRHFPWRPRLFFGFGAAGGILAGALIGRRIVALNPDLTLAEGGQRAALAADLMALYGALGVLTAALLALAWFAAGHLSGRRPMTEAGWPRWSRGSMAAILVVALGLALLTVFDDRKIPPQPVVPPAPALAETPGEAPPPVVLLMIDGADLGVIQPMVEAGELPAFRRLMRRGVWGPLASSVPTLSPTLWTTVATGKTVDRHGIRDFVYYRFPGVGHPVDRLPRYSGLRRRLFPLLERIPGLGFRRAPYTSDLRRCRALWEIVGERYPVGVYRWLITWPAEPVNGFMVSGGVFAGPGDWNLEARSWLRGVRRRSPEALKALGSHPAEPGVELPSRRPPQDGELAAYLEPGHPIDRSDPGVHLISSSIRDPTGRRLPVLMQKYAPRFTAAAFYSVDSFQHHFAADRRDGGPFADAIAERYRFTDRQLGRFLHTLEPDTHLLVISDHGYDFEADHHWDGPPGVFFALGPAFPPGRRVEGLALVDVAPLSLHLLRLPLPEDMPGTRSGNYRRALRHRFLARHPATTIATYERGPRARRGIDGAVDDELRDQLRSLGYLQ